MTSKLAQYVFRFGPPAAAAGCFAYAGREVWQAWRGQGEEQQLLAKWERESRQLDERRLSWASKYQGLGADGDGPAAATAPGLYRSEVLTEVHNMVAVGPAGVHLRAGELVQVLAEGSGSEQGFNVVRAASGKVGIYPKAYLQPVTPGIGTGTGATGAGVDTPIGASGGGGTSESQRNC